MISVRRRAQLGLFAAFVVLLAGMATLLVKPRLSRPVAVADVGTIAPDFQLDDTDGRSVRLSQFRGQAVVLFFGSVDCPRTAEYDARIERLARAYSNDNRVTFLALDVTPRSDSIDRSMLRHNGTVAARGFPTLLDDRGVIAHRYSASRTPTFVVLDPQGVVRYRGPFDNSTDLAFVTHAFCAEALGEVLGTPVSAVAGFIRN